MKLGHRAGALLAASVLAAASGCSTKAPDTATGGGGDGGEGEVAVGRGIEGSTIVLSAALALENLDQNELEATLSDIDLAFVSHVAKLHDIALG